MKQNMINRSARALPAAVALAALVFSVGLLLSGCTDTLQGERNANQRPIVHFANIPPEGQSFSRNPIVYWYGTDVDGLIDQYRYYVATEAEMNGADPEAYVLTVHDTMWNYIDVDPASDAPQTTQSISLIADTANPVRSFVAQWVFLQAFDLEGLGSEIVFRKFSRNDNPPDTKVNDFSSSNPFVNAPQPGGIVTGVRLVWEGEDEIDYPQDPPPFGFQWRLFGPYSTEQLVLIMDQFFMEAFQTADGKIYKAGETFEVCDTVYEGNDTTVTCESYLIGVDDSIPSYLGSLVEYFNIDDPLFAGNADYNRIADSSCALDGSGACISEWVTDTRDTLYNVFWDDYSDTTVEKKFIFWIRARDDAMVPDPSPAFDTLSVIDPRFERDVFVMDWTAIQTSPPPGIRVWGNYTDTVAIVRWWTDRLKTWNPNINFDFRDYGFKRGKYAAFLPLKVILQHKVLILYNDGIAGPPIYDELWMDKIFKGIDAGVNVWVTGRAALGGGSSWPETPRINSLDVDAQGQQYQFYFAASRGLYSGWMNHAMYKRDKLAHPTYDDEDLRGLPPNFDTQDCLGGYSLNQALWPDIEYDSSRVHNLYRWVYIFNFWNPDLPFLPEINWCEARYGAEVMYLYKSFYGATGGSHPLGIRVVLDEPFDYNFEGAPMAHRYNSGLFKTVHMNFTMFGLRQDEDHPEVQQLFDNVMDYLYDPTTTQPVSELRYGDAAVKLSVAEQRARYWKRCDMSTLEKGGSISREAMENLRRTR